MITGSIDTSYCLLCAEVMDDRTQAYISDSLSRSGKAEDRAGDTSINGQGKLDFEKTDYNLSQENSNPRFTSF